MAEDDHLLAGVEALGDGDEIFVYMGGAQRVPDGVRRARIHQDVKNIPREAFYNRRQLISVEFHDGIEIIEKDAFSGCKSLRGSIKLLGVKIIGIGAFQNCESLTDVEFGDKLETIEGESFYLCTSLRNITIPSVRTIGYLAFYHCLELTELDLPEELETIEERGFKNCGLRRIALPLKYDMFEDDDVFNGCCKFTTVDLVGGIHKTVASLHLERWRNEMTDEINRISHVLSHVIPATYMWERKTDAIGEWMYKVTRRLDQYKAEHHKLLKEATTLLELALWKANLEDNEVGVLEKEGVRTRRQIKRARKEISITSGANIVIKNVLPFLELK